MKYQYINSENISIIILKYLTINYIVIVKLLRDWYFWGYSPTKDSLSFYCFPFTIPEGQRVYFRLSFHLGHENICFCFSVLFEPLKVCFPYFCIWTVMEFFIVFSIFIALRIFWFMSHSFYFNFGKNWWQTTIGSFSSENISLFFPVYVFHISSHTSSGKRRSINKQT